MRVIGDVEQRTGEDGGTGRRGETAIFLFLPFPLTTLPPVSYRKDTGHQSYVRQMCTASIRIIQRDHFTSLWIDFTQRRGDSHRHRAKMDRHMIALRDHSTT